MPSLYGYCPACKSPGKSRERRPDGNDTCENGHVYASHSALTFVDVVTEISETSIREHIDAGGTLLNNEQARVLLDEIDSLRKESTQRNQAASDISDENDHLRKLVEHLKRDIQSAPCLVARPGEITYECRIDTPCRVCQWRHEVSQGLRVELGIQDGIWFDE